MTDFIDRLNAENIELTERIVRLSDFVEDVNRFGKISEKQKTLLLIQLDAMKTYHRVLRARIDDLVWKENRK